MLKAGFVCAMFASHLIGLLFVSHQVLVPSAFRFLFMSEGRLTLLGHLMNIFFTVDQDADGAIIELGKRVGCGSCVAGERDWV